MADVTIKYKGANIATMDASGTKTLETSGKYCEGDVQVVYADPEKPTQSKTVTPTASGFTVSPDSGKVLSSVVVNGDADLIASNIRSGKNIFGVDGTLVAGITPSGNKALTPSTTAQTNIDVKNYATASVSAITKELLASLDADFVAENIKKDVDLFGLLGTLDGGGGGGDIKTGTIIFADAVSGEYTITHNLGKVPTEFYIFCFPELQDTYFVSNAVYGCFAKAGCKHVRLRYDSTVRVRRDTSLTASETLSYGNKSTGHYLYAATETTIVLDFDDRYAHVAIPYFWIAK